jgi:hypothetical protein
MEFGEFLVKLFFGKVIQNQAKEEEFFQLLPSEHFFVKFRQRSTGRSLFFQVQIGNEIVNK